MLSPEERAELTQSLDRNLSNARQAMSRLSGHSLTTEQSQTVSLVQSLLAQADKARHSDLTVATQLARRADLRCCERRVLGALLDLPHVTLPLRRLPEYRRARDVRDIAVHGATRVDEHDISLAQCLRLGASVRKRRVLAEDDERAVAHAAAHR